MTRLPFLLLGLVAAGLAAVIARQLEAGPAVDPAPPVAAYRPAAATAPAVAPAPDRALWVATSVARPLFSPDRRPPPAEAAAGATSGPVEPPRLTGILITPTGRRAIFAGAREPLILQEGGRIGGYLVHSISAAQVTVLGPSGPRTLQPSYAPRPAEAATVGAPTAELPFEGKPAPSGLDILRNAAREVPRASAGQPPAEASPAGSADLPGALPTR